MTAGDGADCHVAEKQLLEMRLRALGKDFRGGLLGLLLGRDEQGNDVVVRQVRERLQSGDDYSAWYLAFRDACEELQTAIRTVEKALKSLTTKVAKPNK